MSNMVFSTRPLHNKWGKLRREKILLTLLGMNLHFKLFLGAAVCYCEEMKVFIGLHSRFSQARQIFVSHSADPLVDVVEVDKEELSVAF